LAKKFKKATNGTQESQNHFQDISLSISPTVQGKWAAEGAEALERGGEHLCIYDASVEHG
jgi:hypothetical protein